MRGLVVVVVSVFACRILPWALVMLAGETDGQQQVDKEEEQGEKRSWERERKEDSRGEGVTFAAVAEVAVLAGVVVWGRGG